VLRMCPTVLLVALWPTLSAADRPPAGAWRTLRVTTAGAILLPVVVGGEGPFAFFMDTGSSRSAISASLAHRLETPRVGRTTVLTPSGRVVRPLTPLPRISVDGSPPMPSLAMVVPDDDLVRGVRADGILGADVLVRFVITIDYAHARISLDTPASQSAATLPLSTNEARLVVSVPNPVCAPAAPGCGWLRLIPDSGADGIVLFARGGLAPRFVTPLGHGAIRSLAGVRSARRVLIDAADLQDVGLHGQVASLIDLPAEDPFEVDGLLPLHLFARVTIDGPGKTLTLVLR
jgi:aspartyl protease